MRLNERILTLAHGRPRWGLRRLLIVVRRGTEVGELRFRRIYCSLARQVRPRKKRKVRYVRGNIVPAVSRPNERWSIDFVHGRLANGRNIGAIVIVDDYTRECLAWRLVSRLEVTMSSAASRIWRLSEIFRYHPFLQRLGVSRATPCCAGLPPAHFSCTSSPLANPPKTRRSNR